MFEAWKAASTRSKLLNLLAITLAFLTITTCLTSFGAELFTATTTPEPSNNSTTTTAYLRLPPTTLHFYHDRVESAELGHLFFADLARYDGGDSYCTHGGRALVACAALAFVALVALLALAAARIASHPLLATVGGGGGGGLRVEFALSVASAPLLLCGAAPYGSLCYQQFLGEPYYFVDVRATGYAYSISGVLMAVVLMGVYWVVKADERCWLGVAEGSEYWASKSSGKGDGYREEKLSGFEDGSAQRREAASDDEKSDEEVERVERPPKRTRSKSHRFKSKRHGKAMRVEMKPIRDDYTYTQSDDTSTYDTYQTQIPEL